MSENEAGEGDLRAGDAMRGNSGGIMDDVCNEYRLYVILVEDSNLGA